MSLFLIANNVHFTVELLGALVFFTMAWLAMDAFMASKQVPSLLRVIGFLFIGTWQTIFALVLSSDLVNIIGSFCFIAGILLVIISFLSEPLLSAPSLSGVLIIPAFATIAPSIHVLAAVLFLVAAFLAYRQFSKGFNRALKFFWIGFLVLAMASLAAFFFEKTSYGNFVVYVLELISFCFLVLWVWQYLKLRLEESILLIAISLTLFIATIVTLAFSTILISKIEAETRSNLAIDAGVLDLVVGGLAEEAQAKAKLLAAEGGIATALSQNDLVKLETLLTDALDAERLGFLLVTDKSGTVILRAHALSRRGDSIGSERASEEALTGSSFTTIETSPVEKFSIRAAVPLYVKNASVGVLIAGFPLDNVFADRMKKVTGLEMSIYEGDRIAATTALLADGRTRLSGVSIDDHAVKAAVLGNGGPATARVTLRGESFLASYLPIRNGDEKIVGMFSASKSEAEIIALANATNQLTFIVVIALLLVLALPLYFLTRRLLADAI
jgi:hypothetical protein